VSIETKAEIASRLGSAELRIVFWQVAFWVR